jgi:hypothetical protein
VLRYTPSFTLELVVESFVMQCIGIVFDKRINVIKDIKIKRVAEYILRVSVTILVLSGLAGFIVKLSLGCNPTHYNHDTCLLTSNK